MKTFRYILSFAVLILGYLVGRLFFGFMSKRWGVDVSFFGGLFGFLGFLIAVYLAIKIWPGNQDVRIVRFIVITVSLLIFAIFAISGFFVGFAIGGQYTDYPAIESFIGLFVGGSIGFIVATVLALINWPWKKKPIISQTETPSS